jgi:hypothetical protein
MANFKGGLKRELSELDEATNSFHEKHIKPFFEMAIDKIVMLLRIK